VSIFSHLIDLLLTQTSRIVADLTRYLADRVEAGALITYETIFVALMSNWFVANSASRTHLSRARWIWNFEKTILTGKWAYVKAVDINISEVRKTLQHQSETLWDRVLDAVPGDSPEQYSAFRDLTLEDDPVDPSCLYGRAANVTVLAPFYTAMWAALEKSLNEEKNSTDRTAIANKFLQSMQALRDSVLSIALPTSGITPRPRQVAEAKYRADARLPKLHRNLRIAFGMTFLGNFEDKVHKEKESRSYHPLAPQLVTPIHFLLGVVRKVEILLLRRYKVPTKEFNCYMFVKPPILHATLGTSGARQIYNGTDVNIAARTNPGVGQPGGFVRQMTIAISKTHFPQHMQGE